MVISVMSNIKLSPKNPLKGLYHKPEKLQRKSVGKHDGNKCVKIGEYDQIMNLDFGWNAPLRIDIIDDILIAILKTFQYIFETFSVYTDSRIWISVAVFRVTAENTSWLLQQKYRL